MLVTVSKLRFLLYQKPFFCYLFLNATVENRGMLLVFPTVSLKWRGSLLWRKNSSSPVCTSSERGWRRPTSAPPLRVATLTSKRFRFPPRLFSDPSKGVWGLTSTRKPVFCQQMQVNCVASNFNISVLLLKACIS